MSDCANVEMRELLPELLHGRLDAVERARVEAHLATCDDCATELQLMRATRRAFVAPSIDRARIASAVERESVRARKMIPPRVRTRSAASRIVAWRAAAAIAIVSLGGLSVVVTRRGFDGAMSSRAPADRTTPHANVTAATSAPDGVAPPVSVTASPAVIAKAQMPSDSPHTAAAIDARRPTMAFGGLGDLSEAELEKLLGSVDRLDARPAQEPERIAAPGTSQEEDR